jgi:hypothetical protein
MQGIDITGPKVCTPAALFFLLSPGLILQVDSIPKNLKSLLFTMNTSRDAVLVHALVFMVVYRLVAKMMGLVLKPMDILVPTVLFVLLSPGMLLTLPPGKGGVFRSGQTSLEAIMVHTLVFAVVFALLRKTFPQVY